ncbi:DUF6249 domain-containing protein [Thalassotalea sediminis]|uniref:DUF6249 domain-containing protein n=1 Tax=Thalassotalea sediminis TaxID=1759089 RepID=UPI002573316D|nr:DUF6249 domain-containing protein [Thalassotalea sediminis]
MFNVEVFIPVVLFICIAVILWRIVNYYTEIKNAQQVTVQKLIDSGQELSAELIASISKPNSNDKNRDLSRGIIAISIAIAIFFYGKFAVQSVEFSWLSIFPLMLGIACIIIHKVQPKTE